VLTERVACYVKHLQQLHGLVSKQAAERDVRLAMRG
jgi:hypothetical protein